MKDDRLYLVYILECVDRIETYTTAGKEDFFDDLKTQDAVLRNLHTLSESAQRLSEDLRVRHPEIDWRAIIAFRNVVVHDYLGMDISQIWDIVTLDLPPLKRSAARILKDLGNADLKIT
jgi:uncharacterized protein with HEPN domain